MKQEISVLVSEMVRDNSAVRSTFEAMREHRMSSEEARGELGRAFLGCLWEMEMGLPNRWLQVLNGLREGRSTEELFLEHLSEKVRDKGN
jgi:hypothetical protein